MNVPSSAFTFSASFGSGRQLTPTSSQDDSDSENFQSARQASTPRTLPSAQPPTFLFQGLQLDQMSPWNTPQRNSSQSGLSPGPSSSTYADQHNASPSPRPRPIHSSRQRHSTRESPIPSSHTSQAGGVLNTPGPQSGSASLNTEDIQVPGAFPASSGSTTEAGISQGNEAEEERVSNNIRDENLPRAPIFDNRLQDGLKEVKRHLASLANTMHLSELTQDQSTSIYTLYKQTEKMSKFAYPETRIVGFIGDSGVGKSSLINSLLDQKIARSSREGSACTCVVTEFRHIDDNHTGPFTIEAEFMNTEEMRELLEHLLLDFRRFYVLPIFREIQATEDQMKCKDAAAKAWETLQLLFKTQPRLTIEFLSDESDNARFDILAQLERWAYAGLTYRQGGSDALEYSVIAGDIEECKSTLDQLSADNPDNGGPAMWPFIKLIRVYLSSPILRQGLILTDLPGLRDLNFARVRATERYLAHQCDEVFVVANISRAASDESVGDIMRRCKENQPRRIICTNSENVSPEEASREKGPDGRRVKEMNEEIENIKAQYFKAKSQRMKSNSNDRMKWMAKETDLSDRKAELDFRVTRFLINRRNRNVSRELARKYEHVRVFCVSNTLYSEHRDDDPTESDRYLDLAGIRDLRRYCQLVPAEAQMRATTAFLEDEVPAMVLSIRQWALSGTDPVTAEKAATIRRVLNESQEILRRDFQSSDAHVSSMFQTLKELFNTCIVLRIVNSQDEWKTKSIEVSRRWIPWGWNTYLAFCERDGTYSTKAQRNERPWNEQFMDKTREALDPVWDGIMSWLESQVDTLAREVNTSFQKLLQDIHGHQHLAPQALQNIILGMRHRRENINTHIRNAIQTFISKTYTAKRDMLEYHADSFILALMKPVYNYCQQEGGDGSDKRRKDYMDDHLRNSRLFPRYATRVKQVYEELMIESFNSLQEEINKQLECIAIDFQAVVTNEGEIPEAERAPALASELRSLLQAGQATLDDVRGIAKELNESHD